MDALEQHDRIGFVHLGRAMSWRLHDGVGIRELPPGRRIVVNSGEALVDLAIQGAGLIWVCDFMTAHAREAGLLVEVLEDAACVEEPVSVVSLPSRQVLPKVRVFVEFVAAELARRGVER